MDIKELSLRGVNKIKLAFMLKNLYNYSFCLQLNILYPLRSQPQPKMEAKQT